MEYHGPTEKNVRTDGINMGGDHEILTGKGTMQHSSLISLKKIQICILILIHANEKSCNMQQSMNNSGDLGDWELGEGNVRPLTLSLYLFDVLIFIMKIYYLEKLPNKTFSFHILNIWYQKIFKWVPEKISDSNVYEIIKGTLKERKVKSLSRV